ncbi:hypothetical protein B0H15DRAFT_406992 [Mycena belliarum]|uniref:Uncharacterized protein n=1 Tax=Mycena belliarum TaxID=1033014 RepID=A0AAD6UEY2_9AGAR|nr:hypothetical protein B0H15DRAFT_406992 [Mycena belliae]
MNFTGTAIYVFFALPSHGSPQACGFRLDAENLGLFRFTSPSTQYNVLGYSNTSIPDGPHRFFIDVSTDQVVGFDYAVYTSNDPAPPAISSTSSLVTSTSSSPTAASSTAASTVSSKHSPPVAAIAGGAVGGIAFLVLVFVTLLVWRRRRKPRAKELLAAEAKPLSQPDETTRTSATPRRDSRHGPRDLEAGETLLNTAGEETGEVAQLRAEVQRLRAERPDASTSSLVASTVQRSLSTMKREQTQAVQDQTGYRFSGEALVHTDSGLRLTPGRVVEELPPRYAPD